MKSKHIVRYLGNGVYCDSKNEKWARGHSNPNFKEERTYETTMTEEEFLNSRKDLKFMVYVRSMSITTLTFDEAEKSANTGKSTNTDTTKADGEADTSKSVKVVVK